MRTEYRCSPSTGQVYTVQVPIKAVSSPLPETKKYEWRCNPQTGERFQVEVTSQSQSPFPTNQPQHSQSAQPPAYSHQQVTPQQNTSGLTTSASAPLHGGQHQGQHQQQGQDITLREQLQDKVKGISRLIDDGVTKKPAKPLDFAKKCPAKWAKKVTIDSINLPLFTYGEISELESALSGRSGPLAEGELLAKIRHIKNYLEVCCLNSEPTDFKGYGWTIAKDYALKVESEVEQNVTTWTEMTGGVQTSQLVLAQMDFPRPFTVPKKSGTARDPEPKQNGTVKERCKTWNSCKTLDKCEYEVNHPDKKCILKHECIWCKSNIGQSFKHQEWACKKKN